METATPQVGPQSTSGNGVAGVLFSADTVAFLKRTAVSTLVTLALVGATLTIYAKPAIGGLYSGAGFWALLFFILTPLILKAMMFDRNVVRGMLLIAAKFLWLGLGFAALTAAAPRVEGTAAIGMSVLAGLVTPLAVLALRGAARSLPSGKDAGGIESIRKARGELWKGKATPKP